MIFAGDAQMLPKTLEADRLEPSAYTQLDTYRKTRALSWANCCGAPRKTACQRWCLATEPGEWRLNRLI